MNVRQLTIIVEALTHSSSDCSHYETARERHAIALKYAKDMLTAITDSAKDTYADSAVDEAFLDIVTHRQAWYRALVKARQMAESLDDQLYYDHELKVFERTFDLIGHLSEAHAKHQSRLSDLGSTFNITGSWDDVVSGIKARHIDPEKYFVVEFIEKRENGPYITRKANNTWPDWAEAVNPAPAAQMSYQVMQAKLKLVKDFLGRDSALKVLRDLGYETVQQVRPTDYRAVYDASVRVLTEGPLFEAPAVEEGTPIPAMTEKGFVQGLVDKIDIRVPDITVETDWKSIAIAYQTALVDALQAVTAVTVPPVPKGHVARIINEDLDRIAKMLPEEY